MRFYNDLKCASWYSLTYQACRFGPDASFRQFARQALLSIFIAFRAAFFRSVVLSGDKRQCFVTVVATMRDRDLVFGIKEPELG